MKDYKLHTEKKTTICSVYVSFYSTAMCSQASQPATCSRTMYTDIRIFKKKSLLAESFRREISGSFVSLRA